MTTLFRKQCLEIVNAGDGHAGHYCVGRRIAGTAYWEFYNQGSWTSAGQVFSSKWAAEFKLKQLTAKMSPPVPRADIVELVKRYGYWCAESVYAEQKDNRRLFEAAEIKKEEMWGKIVEAIT